MVQLKLSNFAELDQENFVNESLTTLKNRISHSYLKFIINTRLIKFLNFLYLIQDQDTCAMNPK